MHKCLPKSLNQTSASSRKIKAKQGDNCFIFFASDPSPFNVLQKSLSPEGLHGICPNQDLSPESFALASWWGWEAPVSMDETPGKDDEDAEPTCWGAGTSLASQVMVLLPSWKCPTVSAPFLSLPIEGSGWSLGSFSLSIPGALVSAHPELSWEEVMAVLVM